MKKLFLLFVLLCTSTLVCSCSKVKFDGSKGELVVGLECDYAPFNWTETTQTESNYPIDNVSGAFAEGYDVQIAKRLATSLNLKLVIKKIEWDGLIPALTSGAIDCIIAGMSPTEDRKLSINFTDKYYESNHVLLSLATSSYASAKTFSDLSNANVIGQKNTLYDDLALQIVSRNASCKHLTALDTVPLIVNAIKSGVADLTILEEPVAKGLVNANPTLTYFSLTEEFDVSEEDKVVAIGVRKIDTDLATSLNEALSSISESERIEIMSLAVELNAQ